MKIQHLTHLKIFLYKDEVCLYYLDRFIGNTIIGQYYAIVLLLFNSETTPIK